MGGGRILCECSGRLGWPARGVYFLFEPGEMCQSDRELPRIVRVGTHAVSTGSKSSLWGRLRAHRGNNSGGGNHRGSILRLHIGAALMARDGKPLLPSWGKGSSAPKGIRIAEEPLERQVSAYIGGMRILWLAVSDEPGPNSDRAYIERNAIGLLSNSGSFPDPPSQEWLGRNSQKPAIRSSGLWNVDYTDYEYDPSFLDVLERCADTTVGDSLAPRPSTVAGGS